MHMRGEHSVSFHHVTWTHRGWGWHLGFSETAVPHLSNLNTSSESQPLRHDHPSTIHEIPAYRPSSIMAIIRNTVAPLRGVRCARQPFTKRCLAVSTRRQGGGHGNESQFEPPTGWLWGVKPGEKPEPEGWEWPMYIFCGSLVAAGVALAFKPDTS